MMRRRLHHIFCCGFGVLLITHSSSCGGFRLEVVGDFRCRFVVVSLLFLSVSVSVLSCLCASVSASAWSLPYCLPFPLSFVFVFVSVLPLRWHDGVSRDVIATTLLWLVGVLGESAENWGEAPVFCSVVAVYVRFKCRSLLLWGWLWWSLWLCGALLCHCSRVTPKA